MFIKCKWISTSFTKISVAKKCYNRRVQTSLSMSVHKRGKNENQTKYYLYKVYSKAGTIRKIITLNYIYTFLKKNKYKNNKTSKQNVEDRVAKNIYSAKNRNAESGLKLIKSRNSRLNLLPPCLLLPRWIPSSWQLWVGYGSWIQRPSFGVWRTCFRIWIPSSRLV